MDVAKLWDFDGAWNPKRYVMYFQDKARYVLLYNSKRYLESKTKLNFLFVLCFMELSYNWIKGKGLLSKNPDLVTLYKGRITEAATTMPLLRLSSLLSTWQAKTELYRCVISAFWKTIMSLDIWEKSSFTKYQIRRLRQQRPKRPLLEATFNKVAATKRLLLLSTI